MDNRKESRFELFFQVQEEPAISCWFSDALFWDKSGMRKEIQYSEGWVEAKRIDGLDVKLSRYEYKILKNSEILSKLESTLNHLDTEQIMSMSLFSDAPRRTSVLIRDVEVESVSPITQHPYWVSPKKREIMIKEIEYMLKLDLIELCNRSWSSPCVLVLKPNGSYRFCTDYRKVSYVTKTYILFVELMTVLTKCEMWGL